MKILLDECVTKHLKPLILGHEVFTVREMDWSGLKNGNLMSLCIENQFEIILTIDKNLQFQQNLDKYPITIIIFNSVTSKVEDLKDFIPSFLSRLDEFKKHSAYIIEKDK